MISSDACVPCEAFKDTCTGVDHLDYPRVVFSHHLSGEDPLHTMRELLHLLRACEWPSLGPSLFWVSTSSSGYLWMAWQHPKNDTRTQHGRLSLKSEDQSSVLPYEGQTHQVTKGNGEYITAALPLPRERGVMCRAGPLSHRPLGFLSVPIARGKGGHPDLWAARLELPHSTNSCSPGFPCIPRACFQLRSNLSLMPFSLPKLKHKCILSNLTLFNNNYLLKPNYVPDNFFRCENMVGNKSDLVGFIFEKGNFLEQGIADCVKSSPGTHRTGGPVIVRAALSAMQEKRVHALGGH